MSYCDLPVISPDAVQLDKDDGLLVGLNAGMGEAVIEAMRRFDLIKNNIFFC